MLPAPEGRSYIVSAPTLDLAKPTARRKAQAAGHPAALTARVLYHERLADGRYEIVLEVAK
jgi:hypothetical protein